MFYLRQRVILINLCVMAFMWSNASFSFYMIIFYSKYLPGNIYNNSIASSWTDIIATMSASILYSKIGLKTTFTILLSLSVIGGFMIMFLGEDNIVLMPIFVVLTKFGVSGGFNLVYVSTVAIFPTVFGATALGICNFFARVITLFAP